MSDETTRPRKSRGKSQQPTRKLNFPSRLRGTFRRGADRVLGSDLAWSAGWTLAVVLLLASQSCGQGFEALEVGEVASHDIKAPQDIDVVDEVLTEQRRLEAEMAIREVYVHDAERGIRLAGELASLFEHGRRTLEELSLQGVEDPAAATAASLDARVPPRTMALLLKRRFDAALELEMKTAVTNVMAGLIAGNKALLEREPAIVLMRIPDRLEQTLTNYDVIIDLEPARQAVRDQLSQSLALPAAEERMLADFVASYVGANVQVDAETTHRRREAAAREVPLVLVRLKAGEPLVRKGERITPELLTRIDAARRAASPELSPAYLSALVLVVLMLAFFLYRYALYHQRGFGRLKHLHALLVLMLLSMLGLSQGILWLAREVVDSLSTPFNSVGAYTYLVPLGAGSILVTLLANGRIAIVYSAFASLLYGAMNGWDAYLMVWAMLVQGAGVYAISTDRERAALLRAGLVVGGAGAVTAVALETLRGGPNPLPVSLYGAALAFIGGAVGVGLLISFMLPLLEGLFNVLTDIRLLELSNINNPLLQQLAVKAPGSYNHSLVVGTLAEEGAKAIGGNPLFCRVAAFYHDIGKINKPEYYVENQRGTNPHDRLAPSMSALIIAAHVKDGIKLAREAGLPEQIVDIIPQHHGTKMMTYFYEKARNSTDPALGPVKKEDFRYPGPKPQTREAAIFMLADAVEAAARTVEEPTPNRLEDMIRKVTNAIVLDGQLEECDLTFADLHRIQDAFLRLLVSMYHHRVDYPGFDFKRPKGDSKVTELKERKLAK